MSECLLMTLAIAQVYRIHVVTDRLALLFSSLTVFPRIRPLISVH